MSFQDLGFTDCYLFFVVFEMLIPILSGQGDYAIACQSGVTGILN